MKKLLNNIDNQLIIGITSIVVFSTLSIASIFISQYRTITLNQAELELRGKTTQFTEIGEALLAPDSQRPRDFYFDALRNIAGNDVWILDANGKALLSSTNINSEKLMTNIIDLCSNSLDMQVSYDYSDYFDTRTMTMFNSINSDQGTILGYVLVHQDVNSIYNSYQSLQYLVFISLTISLLLSVILGVLYSKIFTKPIEAITKVTEQIRDGNYNVKTNIDRDDQIGDLAKTIDTMSTEIETNIREITLLEERAKELVANVSHEFKTPLTLIRGYTMNLKDKTIVPNEDVYNKIIKNTVVLEKLVNDLLDMNRYQSGTIVVEKEAINLVDLVNEVTFDMQKIANAKGIVIENKNSVKKSLIIDADYFKLKQLLTIFIDNAIKFSNEKETVFIKVTKNYIEIKDNGIGMEESELEKIFNRYYKVNSGDKGYGLGLCIAKYIADAHSFEIDIKSKKNKGTTIKIKYT